MPSPPLSKQLAWPDAPGQIAGHVSAAKRDCTIIGITGPVGSGKSTLARRIATHLDRSSAILTTDDYLPDYHLVEQSHRDLPEFSDLDTLTRNLESLRKGCTAQIPTWSFQTHRREGTRVIDPAQFIILEGIHALNERIDLDLAVFVDAPRDVRWSRWEALEQSGQRGWGVEKAREYFINIAEPVFSRFEHLYRARADSIVQNATT